MKRLLIGLLCASISFAAVAVAGCGNPSGSNGSGGSSDGGEKPALVNCAAKAISFDGINEVDDIDEYDSQKMIGSRSNDGPTENGIIVCPYYTLKVGGVSVPVYTTRCGKNPHSFAMVNIERTSDDFEALIEISALSGSALSKSGVTAVVLPEKRGVKAQISSGKLTARINSFGSFTFAFNKDSEQGLTLYVYEQTELSVPEGWNKVEISAGEHELAETQFENRDTVYVFKKGRHSVQSVKIPSNATVYLEDGAYLEINPDGEGARLSAITCAGGGENVKLYGHGIIDFSACMGGDNGIKGAFNFTGVTNIEVDGLVSINSNSWTVCFTDCVNVNVSRLMVFGYRTYSDGIMLSDCRDSLVTECFVRTGDDAMETKSTSSSGRTYNVTYKNNDCWTDKGIGYGVIWETNHSVENVHFIDCTIGFAQSNWNERLGALAIQLGDRYESVTDVHFENIQIYRSYCPAVINCELKQKGKLIGDIYFKNVKCGYSEGYLFRLAEVELENESAHFGKFYLDNVSMNGITLTDDNKIDMTKYVLASSWSPDRNVKINTLED